MKDRGSEFRFWRGGVTSGHCAEQVGDFLSRAIARIGNPDCARESRIVLQTHQENILEG